MPIPEIMRGSKTTALLACVAGLIGLLAIVGFVKVDKLTPTRTTTTSTVAPRLGTGGFGAAEVTVIAADGTQKVLCMLLADTQDRQSKGMMNRKDFGGYDGMAFTFSADTQQRFFMANVPVGLSIAWIASNGKVVSFADADPCQTDAADCPKFDAGVPYRTAVEVARGSLAKFGIGEGSTVTIGGPCD